MPQGEVVDVAKKSSGKGSLVWFKHHCMLCNTDQNIEFPLTEQEFSIRWDTWARGALVQQAFPTLSPEQRETMITGICPPCYRRLWPKPPEVPK